MSRVLIVEDETGIGDMLVQYLEGRGYVCQWASNTLDAERLLSDSLPDVVLLDWMLPGRSGYEFARTLRASSRTKHLPIIMLTARDEEESKVKALDVGETTTSPSLSHWRNWRHASTR